MFKHTSPIFEHTSHTIFNFEVNQYLSDKVTVFSPNIQAHVDPQYLSTRHTQYAMSSAVVLQTMQTVRDAIPKGVGVLVGDGRP